MNPFNLLTSFKMARSRAADATSSDMRRAVLVAGSNSNPILDYLVTDKINQSRTSGGIEARLAEQGITLPAAPMPAANYVPFVQTGNLIFVSGQISANDDGLITGKLGAGTSVDEGVAAARRCGLSLIAQLKSAIGDLDRVTRVVKLTGFVNSTPDFTDQPKVINGCSDLMVEVFGEAGRHARAAVSAPSLPFGVAVEVEAVFEVA